MTKLADCDVIVVGAGNAALVAAISARNKGAKVIVLEKAPKALRGGNCRFAGGSYRFWHKGTTELLEIFSGLSEGEAKSIIVPEYSADTWYNKVMRITEGRADPRLLEVLVRESNPTVRWIKDQGVKFEPNLRFVVREGDKIRWKAENTVIEAHGGGDGLLDMFFDTAEKKGIDVVYETKAVKLLVDSKGRVCGVTAQSKEGFRDIKSKAVILACGGFESNAEWRARYLGPGWDLVRPRGTRYNQGDGHRMALEIGAAPAGHWSGCHATTMDYDMSRIPEGQDIYAKRTSTVEHRNDFNYCIQVNVNGKRFLDEGEDFRPFIYAKYGPRLLEQPQRMAWQIFDAKVEPFLMEGYVTGPRITANSIEELAEKLEMPALTETVEEFNKGVQEDVPVNYAVRDGRGTTGITPPKSNWAQKIDTPPFVAYAVGCGITYTFGGLKINTQAQVLDREGEVIRGLYATGEIVGGVWYFNYTGGGGLMLGAVFGRIAGANAAGE